MQYLLFRKVDNTLILVFPGLHKITLIRYKRFKDWLTTRNPFTFEDSNLHSLSTGFISTAGEDEINCDNSKRIRANIQARMDGKSFTVVRFKQTDQAKPLDQYQNIVTIDEVKVHINSTALFTRLAPVAKRE